MNKKLIALVSSVLLASPVAIFAIANPATPATQATLTVIALVNKVLDFMWPLFIGFAVIMFIVAGFKFVAAQGEPTEVAGARMFVIWGIAGVAVGVLAFSLPYIVQNAF